MKLVYIAGKFTALTQAEIHRNVIAAEFAGEDVARLGAMPVIPHKNTENFHGLCTPQFWYEGTLELMRRCDAVYLFSHHDYTVSKGVRDEIEEAKRLGIPYFIALSDLRHWLEGGTVRPLSGIVPIQKESVV
jgi:hypothetical protein